MGTAQTQNYRGGQPNIANLARGAPEQSYRPGSAREDMSLDDRTDTALPGMYIGVAAQPDGTYVANLLIPDYAMMGEKSEAFSDYLANGGMQEILTALLPYANADIANGGEGSYKAGAPATMN